MPTKVPMMPWPRLKCPVPRVRSATTSGTMTLNTAAVTPSRSCTSDEQLRIGHRSEQKAADRQSGKADQQQRPAAPGLGAPADPWRQRGDDQLRHDDAGGDQNRSPTAPSAWSRRCPSAAASRHWRDGTASRQPAKISSGRFCISSPGLIRGLSARRFGGAPCARSGSISASSDVAQRQQRRHQQQNRDDEDGARRRQITDRAHRRGREPVADGSEAGVAPEPLADQRHGRPDRG